jgi:hypothetical protein
VVEFYNKYFQPNNGSYNRSGRAMIIIKPKDKHMSYAKKTLQKGEDIVLFTRPHYIIFYTITYYLLLAIFMMFMFNIFLFAGIVALVGVFNFFSDLISFYYSEYVITNRRVLMKVGFIRQRSLEIYLEKIEGIVVEQNIIGRILNFGTVMISGVGGTKDPYYFIPDPLKFRSLVQQQMELLKSHGGK